MSKLRLTEARGLLRVRPQCPGGVYKEPLKQDAVQTSFLRGRGSGVRTGRCGGELSLGGWRRLLHGKGGP